MRDFVDEYYKEKDLSLLRKLTLIIPTHNRNYYLSRCLWYHAHFPFAEIIVADSSSEEKKIVNRETVSKIREMFGSNIQYLEYDPETEKYGGDIYRKWGDAVQHVETEYSEFCTDKDFVVPTTLCTCVAFLDEHPEFSIAEGRDYLIRYLDDEMIFSPWQGDSSFEQETVDERFDACTQYEQIVGTLFSVQRSENHKKIYSNLSEYNIYDIRFGEISLEMQPFVFGKTKKIIDSVANCRDATNVYTYNSLKTESDKRESSFLRYPVLADYPKKIVAELSDNVSWCFQDLERVLYPNETSDITSFTYIPKLMEKRYLAHPLLRWSKLLTKTFPKLPIDIQQFLSECFSSGNLKPKPSILTDEMRLIQEIIMIYNHLHDRDKVCFM